MEDGRAARERNERAAGLLPPLGTEGFDRLALFIGQLVFRDPGHAVVR